MHSISNSPQVGGASASTTPPRPTLERVPTSSMQVTRKITCFSDFDGTIFQEDTGHILFNKFGCGSERREILDAQIKSGERSFRDVSEEMWGSLRVPFADGFEEMKGKLHMDVDFQDFHQFCLNNKIPFNVISAGLKPVLQEVLNFFLGEEESSHIEVIANDAEISRDGQSWKPVWRHNSALGHDKAASINEYKVGARIASEDGTIPMIIFIGDGISDLAAAGQADVLFARRGLALEEHCIKNNIEYIPFDTFADIQREVIRIARLDEIKTAGSGLPYNFNPRANIWRRASSQAATPIFALKSPAQERMFIWPEAFTEAVNRSPSIAVAPQSARVLTVEA